MTDWTQALLDDEALTPWATRSLKERGVKALPHGEIKVRRVRDADFWGAPVGTPLPLPPKPKIVVRKSPTAAVKARTVSLTNLHHTYDAVGRGGKRRQLVEGQSRWGHGGVYLSRESLSVRKHDTDVFPGPFTIFSVDDTTNGSAAIWRGQGTDRFFNRLLNQAAREAGYKSIQDVGAISDSDDNWKARQATYAKLRRIIEDYGFDGVEVGGEIAVWNYTKLKPATVGSSKQTGEPMGVVPTDAFSGQDQAIYRRAMTIRKRIKDTIAKRTAALSDENKQQILDSVREIRKRGVVMVAAPKDAAMTLLQEDRIKTQFETDKSPTVVAKQTRAAYETAVLDIHPSVDPAKRPVYGYMSVDKPTQRSVGRYGEIRFELKPEVKDRTSIAFGDSLGHSVIPIPLTSDDESGVFGAAGNHASRYDLDEYQDRKFIEAQIRGGVHVSEIAAAYIPDTDDYNDVAGQAETLGITVHRYDYTPQPLIARVIRTAEVRIRSGLANGIRKLDSKELKVGHVRDTDYWNAPYGTPLPLPKRFQQPRQFPDFIGKVGEYQGEPALVYRDSKGKRTGYIIQHSGGRAADYAQLVVVGDDGAVEAEEQMTDLVWRSTRTIQVHDADYRNTHYDIEEMHLPSRRMQYLMKRPYIQAAQRKGGKRRVKIKPLESSTRFSDKRTKAMRKQQEELGLTIADSRLAREQGGLRVPVSMGLPAEETATATMAALERECPGIIDYVPVVGVTPRPVGGVTWTVTPSGQPNSRLAKDRVPYPHANVVLGSAIAGRHRETIRGSIRLHKQGVKDNPSAFSVDPFGLETHTPEQSLVAEVLTHEVGHMVGYTCIGQLPNNGDNNSVGDVELQRQFRHKFQTILADFGAIERRESFDVDVAKNPRANDREQGVTTLLSLDTKTMTELLSEYGATNLNEMLAEVWVEYMLSNNPRPFAEAVGKLMKDTFQQYRKFHAPEVRDYKERR